MSIFCGHAFKVRATCSNLPMLIYILDLLLEVTWNNPKQLIPRFEIFLLQIRKLMAIARFNINISISKLFYYTLSLQERNGRTGCAKARLSYHCVEKRVIIPWKYCRNLFRKKSMTYILLAQFWTPPNIISTFLTQDFSSLLYTF